MNTENAPPPHHHVPNRADLLRSGKSAVGCCGDVLGRFRDFLLRGNVVRGFMARKFASCTNQPGLQHAEPGLMVLMLVHRLTWRLPS